MHMEHPAMRLASAPGFSSKWNSSVKYGHNKCTNGFITSWIITLFHLNQQLWDVLKQSEFISGVKYISSVRKEKRKESCSFDYCLHMQLSSKAASQLKLNLIYDWLECSTCVNKNGYIVSFKLLFSDISIFIINISRCKHIYVADLCWHLNR